MCVYSGPAWDNDEQAVSRVYNGRGEHSEKPSHTLQALCCSYLLPFIDFCCTWLLYTQDRHVYIFLRFGNQFHSSHSLICSFVLFSNNKIEKCYLVLWEPPAFSTLFTSQFFHTPLSPHVPA